MSIQPSTDLSLRRKEQVFVEGYEIEVAKTLVPTLNTTDLVDDVFGSNDSLTETIVDTASLSMDILERKNNNYILDVLTGQDPAATGVKEYYSEDIEAVTVWSNKKNSGDTAYERSFFYKDWTPQIPLSAGAPKERSVRTLNGMVNKPMEFEGAGILGEKVALTAAATGLVFSGSIGNTPNVVPRSGFYALRIVACSGTGSTMIKEDIAVTAARMNSDKWVTLLNADCSTVKGPTAAYVNYLYTGTGIYPGTAAIAEEGLYATAS